MADEWTGGYRRRPDGDWPLDDVLIGVKSLRTLRELMRQENQERRRPPSPRRPWDVALWCGVTPQGSAEILDRLHRLGMVERFPPSARGRARRFRLARKHPLVAPIERLFDDEWVLICRRRRAALEESVRARRERNLAAGR